MYRLVEEALAERAHMLNAAPFMARPLPIMIPIYRWWEVPYMWVGAKMYDFIAGSRRAVPASYYIDKVRGTHMHTECTSTYALISSRS